MPIDGLPKLEETKELAFLINPISGGGIGKEVYRYLPEILDSFGVRREQWTAELTESALLTDQTDRLLNQARRVVAVGGDGTIGFVLSRLRHRRRKDVEIGLIPLGTGNDLGRSLGIFHIYDQKGLLACVQRLLKAPAIRFDLWKINGEHTMASYISVGMDAAILHDFDQARKAGLLPQGAFFNKLFYVKAFFQRSRYRMTQPATLQWWRKGRSETVALQGALCCLVANIDSYASGARPFPEGRINDKCLEILIIRRLRLYLLMVTMSRLWPRGMRLLRRWLPIIQADKIDLRSPESEFAQVDGEDMSQTLSRDKHWIIEPAGHARMLDLRSTTYNLF
jgi:diacylglycerol kinase (ATP)